MDPGADAHDPWCGPATYDGHDGTDIRLRSMPDIARGVPVVAVADGLVLRRRDGVEDRLVRTEADRTAVAGEECGNGVVVEQPDGFEAQYCHMRQGSIAVQPGERMRRGAKIGEVGASGMAQFPHVHLTIRRNGEPLDPTTGRALSAGCDRNSGTAASLFASDAAALLRRTAPTVLGMGFSDGPVQGDDLVANGPPPTVTHRAAARVGWVWLANLDVADEVFVRLFAPEGQLDSEQHIEPLDRSKAIYVAYAGRRRPPDVGRYRVEVEVRSAGKARLNRSETFEVR